MERIGVRELNQHTSRWLTRVKAGETLEISERGRVIAMLVPVDPDGGALERLVASGDAQPPSAQPESLASLPSVPPDEVNVADELAAAREEERW